MNPLKKGLRAASKVVGESLSGGLYQQKLTAGTEERWAKIQAQLGAGERSLLDIGCNVGVFTRRAADSGLLALGCDVDPKAVRSAVRLHRDAPGVAFMLLNLTPEAIRRLPAFDVVLCLSVHHHWVRAHGEDGAWEMMRDLIARANRKLFFEPASRRSKYRPATPGFTDWDRASIEAYNTARLRAAAGEAASITCLGDTPALGKERFRMLFLVDKSGASR